MLKQRVVSGLAWALGGRVLAVLASLLISGMLARLLAPDELGLYFLLFSMVTIASLTGQLGLNRAVVRLVPKALAEGDIAGARGTTHVVIRLGLAGSIVVALVIGAGPGGWLVQQVTRAPDLTILGWHVALWAMLLSMVGLLAEVFRGYHDVRRASIYSGLASNGIAVLALGVIWLVVGAPIALNTAVMATVFATGLAFVFAAVALHRKLGDLPAAKDVRHGEILKVSLPMFATTLMVLLVTQADLWIVGLYRSTEDVARYGAAARLVLLISTPLVIVNAVLPPLIVEMHAQNRRHELEKLLRTVSTVAGLPALFVLTVFIATGGFVLSVVYGENYREAHWILAVLAAGNIVSVWVGTAGITLMMTGHHLTMLSITVVGGIATVLAGIMLVGPYGVMGVAAGTAIGLSLQQLALWWAARLHVGLWTHLGGIGMRHIRDAWSLLRLRKLTS